MNRLRTLIVSWLLPEIDRQKAQIWASRVRPGSDAARQMMRDVAASTRDQAR